MTAMAEISAPTQPVPLDPPKTDRDSPYERELLQKQQSGRFATLDSAKTYRMTKQERELLQQEARSLGMTDQQYFEFKMFGEAKSVRTPGRRRKSASAGQLAMTA